MATSQNTRSASGTPVYLESHPLGFRMLNDKGEEKIYLEDGPSTGILELTNRHEKEIHFLPPFDKATQAGPGFYHFALKFRSGVFKAASRSLIRNKLVAKGWTMTEGLVALDSGQPVEPGNGAAPSEEVTMVLYFLNNGKASLDKGESLRLPLHRLDLDCELGTQVTEVELRCSHLATGPGSNQVLDSHVLHYTLTLVNRRGKPNMPILAGFSEFNAVLNDGSSNDLKLRITNLQKKTPEQKGELVFSHRKRSRIYLYFDAGDGDFALGTADQVAEIELEIVKPEDKLQIEPLLQGNTPVWEIFPVDGDVILQPHLTSAGGGSSDGSSIEINLTNIITKTASGTAHLYLRFENIPGFWDQTFCLPIQKQPLVMKRIEEEDRVGVGTAEPQCKLDVKGNARFEGNARFDGNVGIGTENPTNKLEVKGDTHLSGDVVISADPLPNLRVYGKIELHGSVGIGVVGPTQSLDVLGNTYLRGRLGVGVGRQNPKASLDVERGDGKLGTAVFRGTNYDSHFNIDTAEDTYIRGGKSTSNVILCDKGKSVVIGDSKRINAKLVVEGGEDPGDYKMWGYMDIHGTISDYQGKEFGKDGKASIWASNDIVGNAIRVHSDARLKTALRVSDSNNDLERLKKIEIVDYTHVDFVKNGSREYKKLIAQQVEEVYPNAVSSMRHFIPDVFAKSEAVRTVGEGLEVDLPEPHGLKKGAHLKWITPDEKTHYGNVLSVLSEKSILIESEEAPDQVFVYGQEVDDFRTVDYDAISMLNVSATQELARQLEALQQEIQALKAEQAVMKKELAQSWKCWICGVLRRLFNRKVTKKN